MGGDLHVKAIPHNSWQLNSASGTIRLDLPPAVNFELDASTDSGNLQADRDDITKVDSDVRHFHQEVNGGGTRVEVHTGNGTIVIR